jgi:hypothetical protein
METDEKEIAERLEAATNLLERTLNWLEERQRRRFQARWRGFRHRGAKPPGTGAGGEAGSGGAGAGRGERPRLQRRESAAPDHAGGNIGDAGQARHRRGAGGRAALDAALSGLSLEQRIAVKTQLLRAGAIA